jgi:hypothetical protein
MMTQQLIGLIHVSQARDMMRPFMLVAMLGWLVIVVKADWDATDSLREYMRMRVLKDSSY